MSLKTENTKLRKENKALKEELDFYKKTLAQATADIKKLISSRKD